MFLTVCGREIKAHFSRMVTGWRLARAVLLEWAGGENAGLFTKD